MSSIRGKKAILFTLLICVVVSLILFLVYVVNSNSDSPRTDYSTVLKSGETLPAYDEEDLVKVAEGVYIVSDIKDKISPEALQEFIDEHIDGEKTVIFDTVVAE